MKPRQRRNRKGQSAIEYLTTYGWALLAIVIVGAVLMNMGVFSQCQKSTPAFSGQAVAIDSWTYANSSAVGLDLQAISESVTVEAIRLNYDHGWENATELNTQISQGSSSSFTVSNMGISSGSCASADVTIDYNVTGSGLDGKASSTAALRGPVP